MHGAPGIARWLLAAGLLLLAGAAAALPAATVEALQQHCPPAAGDAVPWPADAVEAQMSLQPTAVLAAACAGASRPGVAEDERRLMALLAAQALHGLSRPRAVAAIVDSLQTDALQPLPEAAEPWRARWFLVAGLQAARASQWPLAMQRYAAAQAVYRRAQLESSRAHAFSVIGEAFGLRATGQLDRADMLAAQAEALLVAHGRQRTPEMTELLNLRALLAYDRQDLPATVVYTRQELTLSRELGIDEVELLDGYATLGAVLSQLGRNDEAVSDLQQALDIIDRRPGENPSAVIGVLHNLAAVQIDRGQPAQAMPVIERALALATAAFGADSPRNLAPLVQRAVAQAQLARYGATAQDLRRAADIEKRQGAASGRLRGLRVTARLAEIQLKLGDLDSARGTLQIGLARTAGKPELGYWTGQFRRLESLLAAREGRAADADTQLEEAGRLIGAVIGPDQPFVISMLADRCATQARAALNGQACAQLRHQLPLLDTAAPGFRHKAYAALALDDEAAGRRDDALGQRLAALAAADATGSADPRWSALDEVARDLRQRGDRPLSVYFGKQSITAIEAMRNEVGAVLPEAERGFLTDKLAVYRRVAEWLFEDGRIAEGLDTLRLLKEEEFLDFVQRDAGLQDQRLRNRLSTQEQAIAARWQALQAQAPAASAGAPGSSPAQREAAWARQARLLVDELVRPGATPPPRAAATEALPGVQLPAGELHVHAFAGATQATLVFESRLRRSVVSLPWDRAAVGRDVGAVLAAMGRGDEALAALQAMYRRVGAPLVEAAQAAGARRVVLHLDGALRYLPWSALHDGRRHLGAAYTFESRVSVLAPPPARQAGAATRMAALGVTRDFEGLKPLRGVAQEVCAIVAGPVVGLQSEDADCAPGGKGQGVVRGQAWMNAEFTSARLRQLMQPQPGRGTLLHVGTHFNLRPGHMARSWLLLGDGSRLTLDDIAQLSFAGQDLVTLSACETGIGGAADADGREVDGLNLLVIRRGAGAVLASLWRVDDRSTSVLMREFYRQLGRVGPAEALRLAQQSLRRSGKAGWAAPYHWAGFYLTQAAAEGPP